MTTPAAPALATLGELRASGHQYKEIKQELRDNLLTKLAGGEERFPGIVGFDETVLPELERALLAGHDVVLLGEVDPIKVAEGRTLGDPETVHYGLVPRTNRGIFSVNELPDLAERIQVA